MRTFVVFRSAKERLTQHSFVKRDHRLNNKLYLLEVG